MHEDKLAKVHMPYTNPVDIYQSKPKTKIVGNWEIIRKDFEKAREGLAKSTRNETARRLTRLLGVLDGKKVVSKLSHFDKKTTFTSCVLPDKISLPIMIIAAFTFLLAFFIF